MADKRQLATDFAHIANGFVELVASPVADPSAFARRLLESLSSLYSAALALPAAIDVDAGFDFYRSSDTEWHAVYEIVGNAFGERDHYWLNFDPIFPRDGSADIVCGSLADDCADIHRDLIGPLRALNDGAVEHLDDILWEWSATPFQSHWGIHATHAIHALHWIVFEHGISSMGST